MIKIKNLSESPLNLSFSTGSVIIPAGEESKRFNPSVVDIRYLLASIPVGNITITMDTATSDLCFANSINTTDERIELVQTIEPDAEETTPPPAPVEPEAEGSAEPTTEGGADATDPAADATAEGADTTASTDTTADAPAEEVAADSTDSTDTPA